MLYFSSWCLKLCDSNIYQSLSLTHEIYQPCDDAFEAKEKLLDISKAQMDIDIKVFLSYSKMGGMWLIQLILL